MLSNTMFNVQACDEAHMCMFNVQARDNNMHSEKIKNAQLKVCTCSTESVHMFNWKHAHTQQGQAPKTLIYDVKLKKPYSDSVALQF